MKITQSSVGYNASLQKELTAIDGSPFQLQDNSLLVERRRMFQLKVAEALETLFHDRKEEFLGLLAHHYYLAESHKKAASYMFMAGEKASRDGAIQTALKFAQQASDLYEMLNDAINSKFSSNFAFCLSFRRL